ncbi:MAG TPA: hypothetical protein VF188_18880 [Longimicrobiales bacterium]
MTDREPYAPEERDPDVELYDAAPPDMPPSPAGADVEIGGEAAASRRLAGLPHELARDPEHRSGIATPSAEPFLGYDGLEVDDVIQWIGESDPEPSLLRAILTYEREHRRREPVLRTCRDRLRRRGEPSES